MGCRCGKLPYFFKKFGMKIINYCFSFAEFLEVNIQHSVCVHILFPFIAYTHDDLCRKLETIFNHSVKGVEFLEEIR